MYRFSCVRLSAICYRRSYPAFLLFGFGFFSVITLVETRWCFVHHCMWTLWFLLRGLTGFSSANVLVFKPLLNYCMALFDSSLLSGYSFEKKEKKKTNACSELLLSTFWTLVFQFYMYILISDCWLKLLMLLWLCWRCLSAWSTDAASTVSMSSCRTAPLWCCWCDAHHFWM